MSIKKAITGTINKALKSKRDEINQKTLKATYKAQKKYGFEIGAGEHATWNNEADAFKHAYMQWYLTWHYGETSARGVGNFHEWEVPETVPGETNMDKWNNAVGRDIAAEMIKKRDAKNSGWDLLNEETIEDYAAKTIVDKMRNGELITDPYTDTRKYEERNFNLKNRVFHKNEITMNDLDNNPEMMDVYLDQAMEQEGLPSKEELDKKVASGNMVYVENYIRSDGTKVSGYYRSYPNC